jgi:hypothetical protein
MEVDTDANVTVNLNDRVEVIEYLSNLSFEDRITLMAKDESLHSILSQPEGAADHLNGGATMFGLFGSGTDEGSACVLESEEMTSAQSDIEAAKQKIAESVAENQTAHADFLKTKETSEALQAERERINEEIVEKTKLLKDLVMAELVSNQKLSEAQKELVQATMRRTAEEMRLETECANEAIRKAEEERLRKEQEAALERQKAEEARLEAERLAEEARQAAVEEAERVRLIAIEQANAARAQALEEAQQAADIAREEAERKMKEAADAEVVAQQQIADNLAKVDERVADSLNSIPESQQGVVDQVDVAPVTNDICPPELLAQKDAQIQLLQQEVQKLEGWTVEWQQKFDAVAETSTNESSTRDAQIQMLQDEVAKLTTYTNEWSELYAEKTTEKEILEKEKDAQIEELKAEIITLEGDTNQWYERYNELLKRNNEEPFVEDSQTEFVAEFEKRNLKPVQPIVKEKVVQEEAIVSGPNRVKLRAAQINNQKLRGGYRVRIEQAFRNEMNELIMRRSKELKEKIRKLYDEKLNELRQVIDNDATLNEEQKQRLSAVLDDFGKESNEERAWFPQVRLFAGYMNKSFEDFVVNSESDYEALSGGATAETFKETNALKELEKCLTRIQTFAERKAHQIVRSCASTYKAKMDAIKEL